MTVVAAALMWCLFAGGQAFGQDKQDKGEAKEGARPAADEAFPSHPRDMRLGLEVIANLGVSPPAYKGACPGAFTLKGQIFANDGVTVEYKILRSDKKQMKPVALSFEKAGAKEVVDTFRFGEAGGPAQVDGWAYIEVVAPVNMKIQSNTVFFKGTCGYKAGEEPREPSPRQAAAPVKPKGASEECLTFDPTSLRLATERAGWRVRERVHNLFSFGDDKKGAEKTLAILNHYKMDRTCFVGRPRPAFHYMLAGDAAPAGPFPGEICEPFKPAALAVRKTGNRYEVTDGERVIVDCGLIKDQADRTVEIMKQYGFTHTCFFGTEKSIRIDLLYLRK